MTKVIKTVLFHEIQGKQQISLPEGSQILSVCRSGGMVKAVVSCPTEAAKGTVTIMQAIEGEEVPVSRYVGTVGMLHFFQL